MARTSNVFARVEPEVKEEAEKVLGSIRHSDVKCRGYVFKTGCFAKRHSF